MHAHRQRSSFILLALALRFLKIAPPPPDVAVRREQGAATGGTGAAEIGLRSPQLSPLEASVLPRQLQPGPAQAGLLEGEASQASCYLLFAMVWQRGRRRRIPALCLPLPASFVAALLSPSPDSRVSKSPNILVETESSCFVMLHSAIQQQLKTILPSCHHLMCHAVTRASVCTTCIAPAVFQHWLFHMAWVTLKRLCRYLG